MSALYDSRLAIRLTAEEKAWIAEAAWRDRVSVAEWVRLVLFRAAGEGQTESEEETGPSDTHPSGDVGDAHVTAGSRLGDGVLEPSSSGKTFRGPDPK